MNRWRTSRDVIIAIVCAVVVVLTGAALFVVCKRRRNGVPDPEETSAAAAMLHAQPQQLSAVESATDGFHSSRVVGMGRLGTVYRAASAMGDVYAVKRIHPQLVLGNLGVGFSSKMKSLSYANHPNVVPILGFCEAPGERLIMTEFVDKARSLDYYLHQSPEPLSWDLRLRIAAGAARGIQHLHDEAAPGVAHGRVKPSNVMVGANFCARVSDYGLSFLAGPNGMKDMAGYADREGNGVCKENDVYGLGVVLLELLSGRRSEGGVLVEWALPLLRAHRVEEVLDARIGAPADMRALTRMAKVASACVGNERKSRPTTGQVAAILSSLEAQPCV